MWLLYGDEANPDLEKGDTFFIYGAVAIPADQAGPLSAAIDRERRAAGYHPSDLLKFNTRDGRPTHVTAEQHRDLKKKVITLAASAGVRLLSHFVLQKIALRKELELTRAWAIDRVASSFQSLLEEQQRYGLVLLDRFDELPGILQKQFGQGLSFSEFTLRTTRILGFHVSVIGTSHFCSLADLVVGSLRQAIRNPDRPSSLALIQQLEPMCLRTADDWVDARSLFLSPKVIQHPPYRAEYRALADFLQKGGIRLRV